MSWKKRREVDREGWREAVVVAVVPNRGGLYTRDRQILRDGEQLDSQSRNNSRCDGEDDLFSHWHHWMTMMRLLCLPDLLNLTATCPDPSLNSQTRWISSISAPRLTDQPIRGPLLMDQQAAAHPLV